MEDGVALLQAWPDVTFYPGQTRSISAYLAVGSFGEARAAIYTLNGVPPGGGTGGRLAADERLYAGDSVASQNGEYRLIYQTDGNLVVYRQHDGIPMWHSNTGGTSPGEAVMQGDGNLVVYDGGGTPRWHSATDGNGGAFAELGNDGVLRVYSSGGVMLWSSN